MTKDLTAFFCPKSVAVIGASRSPEKLGAIVLKNITDSGFTGQIYPVNPNADTINNLKCYPNIKSLPEAVDLIVMAIPGVAVLEELQQVGEKGMKNVVVFAAGFKETGPEGEKLEQQLITTAQKYELNVLGPNCFGFVNNLCPINVTFGQLVNKPGNLRFISQSGAIAASLFDWCKSTNLGFSQFITLGNKAVLNENDILEYFQTHQNTLSHIDQTGLSTVSPIGLYLESIIDGKKFLTLTKQISQKDPIFIIKPGKTQAAAKAMQSHTGAIAGEDAVLGAALAQAGVIRCETLEDFFDLSRAFSFENAPIGPKVAIISNAGGPAVISADAITKEGLKLAEFDTSTKEKLTQILPRSASLLNPVDILGDALADNFAQAAEIILKNNEVHTLIVILTPQIMTQVEKTAQYLGNLSKKYKKPIFCSFIGGSLVVQGEQILNEYKIPVFRFPERAIAVTGAMWNFKKRQEIQDSPSTDQQPVVQIDLEKIQPVVEKAKSNNQKTLDNLQANEILQAAGIPTPPTQTITDLDQAKLFTQSNNWPVVLKLSSPGLLHKKEVGGVVTDINNDDQLETAWNKLQQKITQLDPAICSHVSVQIQKEILNGVEVIIGVKNDPTFGGVLLFGAGGSLAELIADRNLFLLPLTVFQAKKLVEKSKIYSILKGYGIEPSYALDKLYELMVRLGKLGELIPEVSDIEINPVIVTLNDVWAVDGKVILNQGETKPATAPRFAAATTKSSQILAGNFHYLELEAEVPFDFQPGQYISVKVAPDRINCYSLFSHNGNKFSLLVDTTPGGPGSKFFANLKANDKITFLGPFGTFTLKPADGAKQLLFLGTGSGLAPLRPQIEAVLSQPNLPVTLYLSFRTSKEVICQDYLEKLAQVHPNFHYKITVDQADEYWQGSVGYLTELIKEDIHDATDYSVYLCGSKIMIDNTTALLQELGLPKTRIYTEKL